MTDPAYPQARADAAQRLRALGHALVGHRPDVELLARLIAFVDDILPAVTDAPRRPNPLAFLADDDVQQAIAAGDLPFLIARAGDSSMFEDSIVSGVANPMGIAATYDHDMGEAVARAVLGSAFEGAPGRAHGGIVAALFDETMGAVLPTVGTLAYTANLTINYRAPTPISQPLEFRARVAGREGRRITVTAIGTTAGSAFADASGVFIAVNDFNGRDAKTRVRNS